MTRCTQLLIGLALLLLAAPLFAQQKDVGEGDLIPRNGTLMYMVSDRPDVLYRLFGVDKKGAWRLRSLVQDSLNKEFENKADTEEARNAQAILDYIFGSYENLDQVEFGLVDVTLDGPMYLLHLKLKPGKKVDLKPVFLKEFLNRTVDYRDTQYLLYRVDNGAPVAPDEEKSREGAGKDGSKDGGKENPDGPSTGPRPKKYFGMNRYYVANVGGSILVSNFESTIRESIDRFNDRDTSESLSGRAEFVEWRASRTRHDLSVFVVGREIQNLIERLMPSKEQAGVDAQKVYSQIDAWLQFREYRYVVLDMDYEEAVRGVTIAATLKTRRPTKFLEKFAIDSKKFTALRYVPTGAVFTMGAQIGDATQTWTNLVDLARDMEKISHELEPLGLLPWDSRKKDDHFPPDAPPKLPPDEGKSTPPKDEENPWLPKSIGPMGALEDLGRFLKEQEEPKTGPEGTDVTDPAEDKFEKAMRQLDEALAEFGTNRKELLSVLGDQVIVFAAMDIERAKTTYRSGMADLMRSANLGAVILLKDPAKAAQIIARAREKDPQGTFKGMQEVPYNGVNFQVSPSRPYGYAITSDALLITMAMGLPDEDATGPIVASLKSMVDSAQKGERKGFTAEGSKFVEINWGAIARIEGEAIDSNARKLDRYARPPMDKSLNTHMTDFTFAMRTREAKDSIELAVRITGLPDFGAMFEASKEMIFEGGAGNREAYSYGEENLRNLAQVLRKEADDKGAMDLDAMVKAGKLRAGALQTPFDSRWQGDHQKLGWVTLDQVKRDEKGDLPKWVDKDAATIIETNEKAAFRSFVLAGGDMADRIRNYESGFIVAWQEKAETLGGHMVLYADGQVGWLHADTFKLARKLNAEGKPVPAADRWDGEEEDGRAGRPDDKPKNDPNPWLPEGGGTGGEKKEPPKTPKREEGEGIGRPND